jgi:hypothetical protein
MSASQDASSSEEEELLKRELLDHIPRIEVEDTEGNETLMVSVHYSLLEYLEENNLVDVLYIFYI